MFDFNRSIADAFYPCCFRSLFSHCRNPPSLCLVERLVTL
jgi:hypothetical protein